MKNKYYFENELKKLCIKCTSLSESTARKYAQKLYNDFSQKDGCITHFSNNEWDYLRESKNEISKALECLKKGFIESKECYLKIDEVIHVEFKQNQILITTKQNKTYSYSNDFKFLKYIFN
jgi:hypothetical protein